MKTIKYIILCGLFAPSVSHAKVTLENAVEIALKENTEIKSARADFESKKHLVTGAYTPDDPMIGVSRLERGLETTYFTITQKFRFPTKYFIEGKAMKQNSLAKKAEYDLTILETRKKVVDVYYDLYRLQKYISYTLSNLQSVKEVARVAEKKQASGSGIQADSMRSHLEITKLELDLLNYRQEEKSAQARLKEVVGDEDFFSKDLKSISAKRPKIDNQKMKQLEEALKKKNFSSSNQIKIKKHELEAAKLKGSLAKWEFAPDIQLQYQQAFDGKPEDSRIYGIGISFPLFFWGKSAKASAASKEHISKSYALTSVQRKLSASLVDLLGKVKTTQKTLTIYDTTLIPQAEGTYNSSLSAYRAGKLRLIGLLDSERSLYQIRLGYFKTLHLFTKNLSELETISGIIISDL